MLDLSRCPFCGSQLTTTYLPIYEFRQCSNISHKMIYQLRESNSELVYLDYLDNIKNTAIYINFVNKKIQYVQSRGTVSHSVMNIPYFIDIDNFSKNDLVEMQSKIINLIPFI